MTEKGTINCCVELLPKSPEWVETQLAERSLLTREYLGSNPIICNFWIKDCNLKFTMTGFIKPHFHPK